MSEKNNRIERYFDIQARSANEGNDKMIIEGYALKFDKETELWKGFNEVIDRTALTNTDMSRVFLLLNHDANKILAGTTNGSLELDVDDVGLRFKAELVDTPTSKEVYTLAKQGLLAKCSFSFRCASGGYLYCDRDDDTLGIVKDIETLFDVAVVTYPAYDDTECFARDKRALEEEKKARINEKRANKAKERMEQLEWN